jgi:quercetin dioxygenase-like cupin family protein
MKRITPLIFITAILLLATGAVLAQEGDCPVIVQTALAETGQVCSETARNQVCYGNIQLEATARAGVPDLAFSQPGDIINAGDVQSLRLSPLSEAGRTWGVAMMKLQANLPGTLPGQNVTFVLFGDVEVTNAENNNEAAEAPPLQAFYFKTGLNDAPCDAAPDSGLMLQTPEGAGKVHFRANEVEITLGSTAYLQAQPEGDMTVSVLEGQVTLEAFGAAVTIPAGSRAAVPMDDQMRASGPPEEAEPYDPSELAALPVSLLERAVTIEATPEATVEAGSGLVPAAGTWTWVNGAVSESGCPAGTGAFMATVFTPAPFTLSGGKFNLEILMTTAFPTGGDPPPGSVSSEPEPGYYVFEFSDPTAGTGHYEARVISPDRLEGQLNVAIEGCSISIPFVVTRTG